ncbi:MAG TPA: hemerythrin domain-containing protein [Gammaproteobacteria bacterium]|jgi:hemerythrin-like domain-containing protein
MFSARAKADPEFATRILEQHRNIERVLILIRLQVDSLHTSNRVKDLRFIDRAVVYMTGFPTLVHDPSEEFLFTRLVLRSPACACLCDRLTRQQSAFSTLSSSLLGHLRRAQAGDDCAYKSVKQSGIDYCLQYADHIHSEETDMLPSARRRLSREDWDSVDQQATEALGNDTWPELRSHDSIYDFLMAGENHHDD